MAASKSKLKACRECGVVWDTVFHMECPNGHSGLPQDIDWEN